MARTSPYGCWASPVTTASLVEQSSAASQLQTYGGVVYWNERRPLDKSRQVIVARREGAQAQDLLPSPYSARTTVHEYGGRCYVVGDGALIFSNAADQRLYRLVGDLSPTALTEAPPRRGATRFADPVLVPGGKQVICVRERHGEDPEDVVNDLVAVSTDGSFDLQVLACGHDFYSAPRLSPDGARLAYLCWDHPDMPWDASEVHVGELGTTSLENDRRVAGGSGVSTSQPRFSPDGLLHFLSDESGYWNLCDEEGGRPFSVDADCGDPDWVFGQSSYVFLDDGRLVATYYDGIGQRIGYVEGGALQPVETGYTSFSWLAPLGGRVVAVAGAPGRASAAVALDLDAGGAEALSHPGAGLEESFVSTPRAIVFANGRGEDVHALYYPPRNPDHTALPGERPPLIVQVHGGPTAGVSSTLNLAIQYFTTRGFAVVDVAYGGSTGHGRAYRERLNGSWGLTDVEDCAAAVRHLVASGKVDRRRVMIRGGSAGGFTTLAALCSTTLFCAGASHYGVSDLAALARTTHKFESHYLDRLVGPYPEAAEIYGERSPLHHASSITCPVIFFQGLDDPIVPPEQAEAMVEAQRRRGIPVAYLTFPGEQHGFRQADTIRRVAEAELTFYTRVLGITPAGGLAPLEIEDEDLLIF